MTWVLPQSLSDRYLAASVDSRSASTLLLDVTQNIHRLFMSRGKLIALQFWRKRLMKDACLQHQFGRMRQPSQPKSLTDWWISYLQDIHANPSRRPDCKKGTMMRGTGGQRYYELSKDAALPFCCLKMLPRMSMQGWKKSLPTYQACVTALKADWRQRAKRLRHIIESESFASPSIWLTPTVSAALSTGYKDYTISNHQYQIRDQIVAHAFEAIKKQEKIQTVRSQKSVFDLFSRRAQKNGNNGKAFLPVPNPAFLEALMGFPKDWTLLTENKTQPLAMQYARYKQHMRLGLLFVEKAFHSPQQELFND